MRHAKLAAIVHCWGGSPAFAWYPWLKRELELRGYDVLVPVMPDTDEPKIAAWVECLTHLLRDNPAKQLLLVGHSTGCQTILRTFAASDLHAQEAIFVAGWTSLMNLNDEEKAIAEPWLTQPINTDAAKKRLKQRVAVFSKDDPLVPLSNQDFFRNQAGSEIAILDHYGHFDEDAGTTEIPELLQYL